MTSTPLPHFDLESAINLSTNFLSSNDPSYNDVILADIDPDSNANCYQNMHDKIDSQYVSEDQLKTAFSQNDHLSFLHHNIRSLMANGNEFKIFLNSISSKFNFIGLSETWLKDSNNSLFGIDGYRSEHACRQDRTGGGVALYISQQFDHVRRNSLAEYFPNYVDVVFAEITNVANEKPMIIGVFYRPPNKPINEFTDSMEACLNEITKENKIIYFMGDFNINLLNSKNDSQTASFIDCMITKMMCPLINRPTRIDPPSVSLIDHMYSNILLHYPDRMSKSGIVMNDISDHFPIFSFFDKLTASNSDDNEIITYRPLLERNLQSFRDFLSRTDWSPVTQNNEVNTAYSQFEHIFTLALDQCLPKINKRKTRAKRPWVTQGLINSIKRKSKLYKQYLKHPCELTLSRYRLYRNKLKHLLRAAERNHARQRLNDCAGNARQTWRLINEFLSRKTCNYEPQQIKNENDQSIESKQEIADYFNKFFVEVGKTTVSFRIRNSNTFSVMKPNNRSDCLQLVMKRSFLLLAN